MKRKAKREGIISETWFRYSIQYGEIIHMCQAIKKEYGIDDENIDVRKVKKLIQNIFKIRTPRLYIKDLREWDCAGCTLFENKTPKSINIDANLYKNERVGVVYSVLAHEMRHVWQHKKGYTLKEKDGDVEKYCLSPTEVDAEAFAAIFVMLFFLEDTFIYDLEPEELGKKMTVAVSKRIKEIELDIIFDIMQYYKKIGIPVMNND